MDTSHIKTWFERVAHLDKPTDFAERCAAIEEVGELRRFIAALHSDAAQAPVMLTNEQREAIEWAAGRAHVESLGKHTTGAEFQRWRVLSDMFRASAPRPMSPRVAEEEIDAVFRRNFDLLIGNMTVDGENVITWMSITCRGVRQSLYPRNGAAQDGAQSGSHDEELSAYVRKEGGDAV